MPKVLNSHLDKVRDSFDKATKELVAQMRKKALKTMSGQALEDLLKFMPDQLESWVQQHPDFTRGDFTNSRWGELASCDWLVPTCKALAFHRAYETLRLAEKEMLKGWKSSA